MATILKVRWCIVFSKCFHIENNEIVSVQNGFTRGDVVDYESKNKIMFDKYALNKSQIIEKETGKFIKYLPGELIDIENNTFIKYYAHPLDNSISNDDVAYIDMDTLIEYPSDVYFRDVKMFNVQYVGNRSIHTYRVVKYYSEARPEYLPSITIKAPTGVHDTIKTIDNYLIVCSSEESKIIEITPGLTHYLTHIKYKHPEHDYFHVFKMNVKSVTKPAIKLL